MKPTSLSPRFDWLHRQGLRVSDKLASEGFTEESEIVHLLAEDFLFFAGMVADMLHNNKELMKRLNDPDGITPDEKEEARRDHLEGDHE